MKMNYALVLGLCLTTSLTAQTNSSATPKPAPKPAAKPAPAKAIVEPTVSLVPGPATVNATRVQLRARSTIMGEREIARGMLEEALKMQAPDTEPPPQASL